MRISDWSSDVCSSDLRDLVLSLKSAANRAQRKLVVDHRDLFRRPLIPAELNRFEAVILDPPRAGAREQVQQLAQSDVPAIAYISCNPGSFASDAKLLTEAGYVLATVKPVGQFRWSTTRTSVVSGTSVSLRVDPGGCRTMKKK